MSHVARKVLVTVVTLAKVGCVIALLTLSFASAGADGAAVQPLPEGWSEAKDAQNRTYFWHTKTRKVQWERPTEEIAA